MPGNVWTTRRPTTIAYVFGPSAGDPARPVYLLDRRVTRVSARHSYGSSHTGQLAYLVGSEDEYEDYDDIYDEDYYDEDEEEEAN